MDSKFLPAMTAAYAGSVETFESLIEATPSLATDASTQSHPCLLQFVAVETGLDKIADGIPFAKVLARHGANLDRPFVAAASVGARELLMWFLDAGVEVDACAPWTALEEALYWGRQDIASILLERGAQVRSLRAAAGLGDLDAMSALSDDDGAVIDHSGKVAYPWGFEDATLEQASEQALIVAVRNRQLDACNWLLERGVAISTIAPGYHEQCTPLHYVCHQGDAELANWLLDRGADATVLDNRFEATPIGWARHAKHDDLADQLETRLAES